MTRLDGDLRLLDVEPIHGRVGEDLERFDFPVRGLEDCRLFEHDGRWYANATSRELDPEGVCRQVLLGLDDAEIRSARVMPGPRADRHEKNWMPYTDSEDLLFVYTSSPTVITRVDPASGLPEPAFEHDGPEAARDFRGGSQGVRVADGALFVIHEAFDHGGPRRYMHRFILFDDRWQLTAATGRFHFTDNDVEICTGMAKRGDQLILSFGIGDFAAALAVCGEAEIIARLKPIDEAMSERSIR